MKLEEKIAYMLINQGKTLSLAESCSGGLLSSRLTDVPGSSNFLIVGLVTYSNAAKAKLLNIDQSNLRKYGAVSEKIAILMAQNVRKIQKTDFGISITGIAGPSGGTKTKPVGLTYIAISTKNEVLCLKCQFKGTRLEVKKQASSQALKLLEEFLN